MKLYELTTNYQNLLNLIDNEEVPQEVLKESLDQVQDSIAEKVENIAKLVKSIEADTKCIDEEIKRLQARKRALNNSVSSLKSYMLDCLKSSGLTKVIGKIINVSIRKTKSVNVFDENLVGEEFKKIEYKINKTDIKKAIEAGQIIAGAEIIQNESINMR